MGGWLVEGRLFCALIHSFPCLSLKGRQEPVICGDEEAGSLGG